MIRAWDSGLRLVVVEVVFDVVGGCDARDEYVAVIIATA